MIRPRILRERLIALLVLAVALLMPPVLLAANHPVRIFGVPALYAYLFMAWGGLILCAALVGRRLAAAERARDSEFRDGG